VESGGVILNLLASVLLGYFLGSLPFGLWIGRARGVELTEIGSRNIGATNAFRVLGPAWGGIVFLLDTAKGAVAASAPRWLPLEAAQLPLLVLVLAAGVAAVIGHMTTPLARFRGGKGVATSLGVFLAIAPVPTVIAFGLWVALFLAGGYRVSVGSIGAAAAYPFLVWFLPPAGAGRALLTAVAAAVAAFVILRHKANIRRLLAGAEPPILKRRERSAR
jgi:glycerol-3-phosphate acyltransferase PlsY